MEIKIRFDKSIIELMAKRKKEEIEKSIDESIQEIDSVKILHESYDNSELNVKSGILYNSFQEEKSKNKLKLYSNIIYSRIQDLGGWTGKNYTTYIKPTYYFTEAAKKIKDSFIIKMKQKISK